MKKTTTLKKIITTCFILTLSFWLNTSYGQTGADTPTNCFPPIQVWQEWKDQFFATYPNGGNVYDLTQSELYGFSNCDAPPSQTGTTTVHSYGATFKVNIAVNGGAAQSIQSPCQVTVRMTKTGGADPSTGSYDTEMLQLDVQGGTLPPGVMIRESPTLQSTGQTTISHNGTGYHIDSFFDIFTQLSTDGGQTWVPSNAGPGHVTLITTSPTVIPTMSQWGLIVFSVSMLIVIMGFVRKGQIA